MVGHVIGPTDFGFHYSELRNETAFNKPIFSVIA